MFETAELGRAVTKEQYAAREPSLRTELLDLQTKLREHGKFPLIVLINGVDGAGKGETVNLLHEWMDPRHLQATAFGAPTDEERARPPFWRYWRALPPRGKTGIFFGNWYTAPIVGRAEKTMSRGRFFQAIERIRLFESGLVDDGALIVKLWFHLSKEQQQAAYDDLRSDKRTRWRVTDADLERHERYERYRKVSADVVEETSTASAPWTVIEAADRRYRELAVGETLVQALAGRLAAPTPSTSPAATTAKTTPRSPPRITGKNVLDTVDLSARVDKDEYERVLPKLQQTFHKAVDALREDNGAVVVVFEGWDAAGKGGAVRRLTEALDARDYRVIPIAAPTDEERAQHYLWRFWRHLPAAGKVAIYDRSWYGRVLVERVEGFCPESAWRRAYGEINEYEEELSEAGVVVIKLWLHVDADEQMRRFKERENTPHKRFKITEEDWRNREKWPAYERAVHEMVERTSTLHAPWHLVSANDKLHARVDVLRHAIERLKARHRQH